MGTRSLVFLALIGGAVSGTVVSAGLSVWLTRGSGEPTALAPPQNATRAPDLAPPATPVPVLDPRWAGIDQRLAALEDRSSVEASTEAEAPVEAGADVETNREWFARRLEEHREEQVDPNWAKTTSVELTSDLARVQGLGDVSISRVSCRNTTCTAQAEWPDRATALRDYTLLVHVPFRVNCERTIILPEPSAGETKVAASLFLDCESWRADGSPLIDAQLIADLRLPSRRDVSGAEAQVQ